MDGHEERVYGGARNGGKTVALGVDRDQVRQAAGVRVEEVVAELKAENDTLRTERDTLVGILRREGWTDHERAGERWWLSPIRHSNPAPVATAATEEGVEQEIDALEAKMEATLALIGQHKNDIVEAIGALGPIEEHKANRRYQEIQTASLRLWVDRLKGENDDLRARVAELEEGLRETADSIDAVSRESARNVAYPRQAVLNEVAKRARAEAAGGEHA